MKILYFSTVNWKWIKQRPHFFAEYLSKHDIEVDYFSLTPFGKQKIKRNILSNRLNIKDTYVIPFSSRFRIIKRINILYTRAILSHVRYDKIILTHPNQYEYLTTRQKVQAEIIYECMDNMPYFYADEMRKKVQKQEENLCHESKKIIVSSQYLKDRLIRQYKISANKIQVVLNAVDKKTFLQQPKLIFLNKPNLVYIGTISEWVDVKMLIKFANDNPGFFIYLIGPANNRMKQMLFTEAENIIYINSIPHEQVKDYIYSSDIMLIPFKISDLINGVDPIKMYEYLALGSKVISSYWPELDKYKDNKLVKFYSDYSEFKARVNEIKEQKEKVINNQFIEENSWEKRVKDYISILKK